MQQDWMLLEEDWKEYSPNTTNLYTRWSCGEKENALCHVIHVGMDNKLINYLIDTFSREGDWVLDLFSGSGKLSHITYEIIYQVLLYVLSFIILLF